MTTEIDNKIQKLFDRLTTKKAEVAALESKTPPKTHLSFPLGNANTASSRVNLHTATVPEIVACLGNLIQIVAAYDEASKILGVKEPFLYAGHTFEDWKFDMTTRVSRLNISERKKELADLEKKLNAVVSPEQRRLLEIEAITKALD